MNKYYEILGLKPGATQDEIKKAWKKMALEWHPDRNKSEEAGTKIQEINEAYEILTGKKQAPREEQRPQGQPFQNPFGNRHRGFRMKARPSVMSLDITVEEVYSGVNKKVKYHVDRLCNTCRGVGGKSTTCSVCNGAGMTMAHNPRFGIMMGTMCNTCGGSGQVMVDHCGTCRGRGTNVEVESIDLKIPKGTSDQSKIIVTNGGNDVPNADRGDVYFTINVMPHPIYQIDGLNVSKIENVSFIDMVLGKDIEIDTLAGKFKVSIPPNCESNKVLRLKGLGMTDEDTQVVGDFYIKIVPKIPKEVTDNEKQILETLRESTNFS